MDSAFLLILQKSYQREELEETGLTRRPARGVTRYGSVSKCACAGLSAFDPSGPCMLSRGLYLSHQAAPQLPADRALSSVLSSCHPSNPKPREPALHQRNGSWGGSQLGTPGAGSTAPGKHLMHRGEPTPFWQYRSMGMRLVIMVFWCVLYLIVEMLCCHWLHCDGHHVSHVYHGKPLIGVYMLPKDLTVLHLC